jgi:LuxR family maltose regulon positive regulatory protein
MEPEAETLLMHSQLSTLMRWVDALPPEERRAHPLLLLYHAWAQAFSAHPVREVTAYLAEIEALGGLSPARIDPLRAYLLALQGETGQAVEVANRAAAELTEGDRFLYAVANWLRGLGLVYSGDLQAAMQALEQVVQLGLRSGNVAVTVMTLCSLGDQITSQGYFDLAEKTYQKALSLAYDAQGARLPVAGMVIMRLAEILRERNRLAEAEAMLLEGMDQIAGWNEMMAVNAHISWAIIRQERGDARGADEAIAEAARLARHYDITEMDDQTVEQYRLFVHLLRRDLAFARRWLENRPNPTDFGERPNGWRIDERERIMQARALTATGRPAEAAAILRPIRAGVEQAARRRRLTEVSALLALAESAQGQLAEALQTLRPVLSLAREHGYLQTLIDEGEPLRALLEEAARQGESAADARALLAAFPPAPPAAETDFEPFSARELEVMRLIAGGYSNAEIAARLFITERTVKFHTGNILAKLGVKNRTQAVLRAREMGLIAA